MQQAGVVFVDTGGRGLGIRESGRGGGAKMLKGRGVLWSAAFQNGLPAKRWSWSRQRFGGDPGLLDFRFTIRRRSGGRRGWWPVGRWPPQ